jgi:hypothetical protein
MLLKKKQSVLFAGENHLINLYYPGTDKRLISTSCWRCTYSEHGEGFVLCVSGDNSPDLGMSLQLLLTDNLPLSTMVVERFNQYFEGFRDIGFEQLRPQMASFTQYPKGKEQHYIRCISEGLTLELIWLEVIESALEIFHNTSGPIPYDVSAVICSCRQGQIFLNGERIPGEVRVPDGASASSAFLAFSETWVNV